MIDGFMIFEIVFYYFVSVNSRFKWSFSAKFYEKMPQICIYERHFLHTFFLGEKFNFSENCRFSFFFRNLEATRVTTFCEKNTSEGKKLLWVWKDPASSNVRPAIIGLFSFETLAINFLFHSFMTKYGPGIGPNLKI